MRIRDQYPSDLVQGTDMDRFWLVLFLLLSTLSSNPLGSMEQCAPERVDPLVQVVSATPLRLPDGGVTTQAATRSDPEPRHLQNSSHLLDSAKVYPTVERILPKRDPVLVVGPSASLLERLPYFANAPPAAE
jgi:hypothetical protein